MRLLLISRINIVWLILAVATLFSWESVSGFGAGTAWRLAQLNIIIAFAKAWVVGWEYMELRAAPLVLRVLFTAWASGACTAIVVVSLL